MLGRRRPIPELAAKNKNLQAFGKRVAMNSPIQGSAADIIKLAMIGVSQAIDEAGIDARLILQVHDELIVEARPECATQGDGKRSENYSALVGGSFCWRKLAGCQIIWKPPLFREVFIFKPQPNHLSRLLIV